MWYNKNMVEADTTNTTHFTTWMRELTHDLFDGKVSLEDYRAGVKKFTKYQLNFNLKKKG